MRCTIRKLTFSGMFLALYGTSLTNAQNPLETAYQLPERSVGLHIHSAPDVVIRSVTDLEAVNNALDKGMGVIMLKSHVGSTAARAEVMLKENPYKLLNIKR